VNALGRIATVGMIAWVVATATVAAQDLTVRFGDGRVTVRARHTPLSAILEEWARLGSTTIINGDRLAGQLVTLELDNVPEREALAVLLHEVPGYVLSTRRAAVRGSSTFDRVLIMPPTGPSSDQTPQIAASVRSPTAFAGEQANPQPAPDQPMSPRARHVQVLEMIRAGANAIAGDQSSTIDEARPDAPPVLTEVLDLLQRLDSQSGGTANSAVDAIVPRSVPPASAGSASRPTFPAGTGTPGMVVATPAPPRDH